MYSFMSCQLLSYSFFLNSMKLWNELLKRFAVFPLIHLCVYLNIIFYNGCILHISYIFSYSCILAPCGIVFKKKKQVFCNSRFLTASYTNNCYYRISSSTLYSIVCLSCVVESRPTSSCETIRDFCAVSCSIRCLNIGVHLV